MARAASLEPLFTEDTVSRCSGKYSHFFVEVNAQVAQLDTVALQTMDSI
jgi:hypothetical protein